jgi:colanic acid biosynthesis glycosyl transferase WcaI
MRIAIHDFVGHPFQVQLSRELARRGHTVLHVHFPAFVTPKGRLQPSETDPPNLSIIGIHISKRYPKYSYVARYAANRQYSRACASALEEFGPEVLLSGNAPPDIQAALLHACRRRHAAFIYWVQDFYGDAIGRLLRKRYGPLGSAIGGYFRHLDASVLRGSDQVVLITDDFLRIAYDYGVPPEKCHVVENWAVLDELPCKPRLNGWSRAHGLDGKTTFLYAGTLGLKHNPSLIVELARLFKERRDVAIVVVSEGLGRDWLQSQKAALGLDNLHLFDFQPFEVVPEMTAAGDILVAMIGEDAGVFSVPSKVLTYLCARRPMLVAAPSSNLASRTVVKAKAGLVVDPGDVSGFLKAGERLASDEAFAQLCGRNGRAYAEASFNIKPIADRFETVFELARIPQHGERSGVMLGGRRKSVPAIGRFGE